MLDSDPHVLDPTLRRPALRPATLGSQAATFAITTLRRAGTTAEQRHACSSMI